MLSSQPSQPGNNPELMQKRAETRLKTRLKEEVLTRRIKRE